MDTVPNLEHLDPDVDHVPVEVFNNLVDVVNLLVRRRGAVLMLEERRLAAAFTEWDRRYREEPDRFYSEARHLLKETPETYGDACAPYLLAILAEQTASD